MEVRELALDGVLLITPRRHADERGFFSEVYNARDLAAAGVDLEFVQDNHAHTVRAGTVRGLHFQIPPHPVAKLVRVAAGAIFDVVVDVRSDSPDFGRHLAVELTADEGQQLLVPVGYAHGYCTLAPDTDVVYKVTDHWGPDVDVGFRWNDPAVGIDWPVDEEHAVLSDKDRALPLLSELPPYFSHGNE